MQTTKKLLAAQDQVVLKKEAQLEAKDLEISELNSILTNAVIDTATEGFTGERTIGYKALADYGIVVILRIGSARAGIPPK